MHQEVINIKTKRILETLSNIQEVQDFYLAGGTALALQLGHRKSIDLDWFSQKKVSISLLKRKLFPLGKFKIESEDEDTLNCQLDNIRVSFFVYPYKLLFPFKDFKGIKLADERDIGCMKIDTISSRGAKKDFIDLYFLLEKYSLKKLLDLFDKKYKGIQYNRFHILKSLIYFEQAEAEPIPVMIKKASWSGVKNKLKQEVKKIV